MTATTDTRKRSGISGNRAYRLQRKFVSLAEDIFATMIAFRLTWEDMSESVRAKIYGSEEWARVPAYVHSYLEGYLEARRNEIYRYHLGWLMWVDGRLMTSEEIDALTRVEESQVGVGIDAQGHAIESHRRPWSRVEGDKSRHVWLDRPKGNPLADKPLSRMFRNP